MPNKPKRNKNQLALARFLRKHDGHLGRDGDTANQLAIFMGRSIHLVQSVALGRRNFSDSDQAKANAFIETIGA